MLLVTDAASAAVACDTAEIFVHESYNYYADPCKITFVKLVYLDRYGSLQIRHLYTWMDAIDNLCIHAEIRPDEFSVTVYEPCWIYSTTIYQAYIYYAPIIAR